MTDDKTALADLPGFRVGSDGGVTALTEREVDVLIARVIREAMHLAGWPKRTLH
jgi:hypothetical protein